MAVSVGGGFNVSNTFLKRLVQADKEINNIEVHSREMQSSMLSLFKEITKNGVEPTIERMKEMRNVFETIKKTNIKVDGFKELKDEAKGAIKEIDKLIKIANKVAIPSNSDQLIRNNKEYWSWEISEMERYHARGTQAEQDMKVIRERNLREYAAMYEKLLNDRDNNAKLNARTKQNSEEATRMFNERVKTWEEGFKRAEDKEKAMVNNAISGTKNFGQAMTNIFDQMNKAMAKYQSQMRSDSYDRMQRIGDTSGQATAAYNRLFSSQGNLSFNNMQSTIAKLSAAQQKLNLDTDKGREKYQQLAVMIKRVEQRMKDATSASDQLNRKHRGLLDIGDQLMRKFALVFSVSQIQGYVQRLSEVRGEFELQQKALQAILQNRDAADKIWKQTIDLAVKSPFRVGELIKYTKQLAAYRIETDKLHDTTKRLADVSAGLGVDMNRLILAFGQVRAASYLRGTELRQFTEAGIPMLEELATYFTELEGKAVSVGDVFSRISKRMVAFGDVEEVFKRMTDAGGIFYDMQEIQAETLKGQISNLHDSVDLMLNDIGLANDSILKGGVSQLKFFVDNWREVASQLKTVVTAFVAVKTSTFLFSKGMTAATLSFYGLNDGIKASTLSMYKWQASLSISDLRVLGYSRSIAVLMKGLYGLRMAAIGLGKAFLTMLPIAIVTGVYELYRQLTSASRAAAELQKEMERIDTNLSKELTQSIALYGELTAKLKDATLSYAEREKAMSALKRTFQDILPDQYLEIENIQNVANNYQKATEALKQYYNAKSREQKLNRVDEMFESELSGDVKELVGSMFKKGSNIQKSLLNFGVDEKHVRSVLESVVEDVKKGTVEAEKLEETFIERLNKMYGRTDISFLSNFLYREDLSDLIQTLQRYRTEVEAIQGMDVETIAEEKQLKEYEKQTKEYEKQIRKINELKTALSNLYRQAQKNKEKGSAVTEKDTEVFNGYRKDVEELYKSLGLQIPRWQELGKSIDNAFSLDDAIDSATKSVNDNFIKGLESGITEGNALLQNLKERIQANTDTLRDNDIQEFTRDVFTDVSSLYKIPLSTFDKLKADGKQSLEDVRKNVEAERKNLETLKKEYDASKKANAKTMYGDELDNFLLKGFGITPEQRNSLDITIKAFSDAEERLGKVESATTKEQSASIKILNKRISLLKEIYKKYKELEDEYGKDIATQKIIESYRDTFKEAFEGTKIDLSKFILDTKLIDNAQKMGEDAGSALSEGVISKLTELAQAGTYIRSASDKLASFTKQYESFRPNAYWDSLAGVWTVGYGTTSKAGIGFNVTKDTVVDEQQAEELLLKTLKHKEGVLNRILDNHKDLIITQEQYNALLDAAYQGGGAYKAIDLAYGKWEDFEEYLKRISTFKQGNKTPVIIDLEEIKKEWESLDTLQEKLALTLKWTNITNTKKTGQGTERYISSAMQERSIARSKMFSGDIDIANHLKSVITDLAAIDFTTPEGLVKALEMLVPIAKKEGEEAMLVLSKEISGFEAEIGINLVQSQRKELVGSIESMFGNYELSLELDKLNIPSDVANKLFGIDTIDLSDIRSKIEDEQAKTNSKKTLEELEKLEKKVSELERKEQKERLNKYIKYLKTSESETLRIKIEELKQLSEIEKTFRLTEDVAKSERFGLSDEQWKLYKKALDSNEEINEQKLKQIGLDDVLIKKILEHNKELRISAELARQGVKKETEELLSKSQWNLFKETAPYQLAFSDIKNQTSKALDIIEDGIKKIEGSLSHLDVSQMKELVDLKNKAFELKSERNPYKTLGEYMEKLKALKEQNLTPDSLLDTITISDEKISAAQKIIDDIIAFQETGIKNETAIKLETTAIATGLNVKDVTQSVITEQQNIITNNKQIKSTAKANLDVYNKTYIAAQKALAKAQADTQAMQQAYGTLKSFLSTLGVEMDENTDALANIGFGLMDIGMQIAQIAVQAHMMGVSLSAAMGPIGWISIGLTGVTTILGSIFGAHDASLERQIKRTTKYVEKLQRALQDVEEAISNSYSVGTVMANYEDAMSNINKQIAARRNIIELEKDKKKTDWDKIDEQLKEIEDLTKKLNELEQQRIADLGGFGSQANYKSATETFVDSWYSAFLEVGDGLDALDDSFDDLLNNVVKKQLLLKGSEYYLKPIMTMIDKAVADGEVTTKEMFKIREKWDNETKDKYNAFLNSITEMYDGLIGGTSELSDLEKGIQNITEPQAAAIEAYLNSIRFFVSQNNEILANIYKSLDISAESPTISELKRQTTLINAIDDRLASVIGIGGSSHTGSYLKVLVK